MALSDPRWDDLTDTDWDAFACVWLAELSGDTTPELPELPGIFPEKPETTASVFVVQMNFTASPEAQWRFIESVFRLGDDEAMGHLAAGPVEHLLGNHGDAYIDRFESLAYSDPRFARMLSGCYKYKMSDSIWDRICVVRDSFG